MRDSEESARGEKISFRNVPETNLFRTHDVHIQYVRYAAVETTGRSHILNMFSGARSSSYDSAP